MDNPRRSSGGTPKSSAQLGNLTGPARVLNDIVVSFHNCIQKWNEAYLGGVRLIQSIQANNGNNEDQFQASCEKLASFVDVLRLQQIQMSSYAGKLNNLKALHDDNRSTTIKMPKIAGVSWTLANFGNDYNLRSQPPSSSSSPYFL